MHNCTRLVIRATYHKPDCLGDRGDAPAAFPRHRTQRVRAAVTTQQKQHSLIGLKDMLAIGLKFVRQLKCCNHFLEPLQTETKLDDCTS